MIDCKKDKPDEEKRNLKICYLQGDKKDSSLRIKKHQVKHEDKYRKMKSKESF